MYRWIISVLLLLAFLLNHNDINFANLNELLDIVSLYPRGNSESQIPKNYIAVAVISIFAQPQYNKLSKFK